MCHAPVVSASSEGSQHRLTVGGEAPCEVRCQRVVNAAGLWAREVGAMAGVYLPLHPMEHQYIVTDEIPDIYNRETEHPHVMDPGGESYLRQEGRGLCIGFYEQPCKPWAVDGTSWDFGHELLPDNLDKIKNKIFENLKGIVAAPNVQMHQTAPDAGADDDGADDDADPDSRGGQGGADVHRANQRQRRRSGHGVAPGHRLAAGRLQAHQEPRNGWRLLRGQRSRRAAKNLPPLDGAPKRGRAARRAHDPVSITGS